jgi:hypothetical protein
MNIKERVNEILTKNGLDFTISKLPLVANGTESEVLITPYYGLFNSQTRECINTCKEGYTISQNSDVIEMVLTGMDKFGEKLSVSKAGSINGGRRVFVQLEIEGATKIGKDTMKQFVTVIDSNDGSTGLSVGIGDLQMHCENQFFKFYKAGNSRFRHTATITQKIQEIPMLIEVALAENLKQVRTYEKFLSTKLTKNLADKMVKEVLGYDRVFTSPDNMAKMTKRSTDMMDVLYNDIKTEIDFSGSNLFSLFQGVTRYTTHHQIVPKREGGKDETLIVGAGYKKAVDAFEFCLAV